MSEMEKGTRLAVDKEAWTQVLARAITGALIMLFALFLYTVFSILRLAGLALYAILFVVTLIGTIGYAVIVGLHEDNEADVGEEQLG
jgi:hypothetical protein